MSRWGEGQKPHPNSLANLKPGVRACRLHRIEQCGKQRRCRVCRNAYARAWKAKQKEKRSA